MAVEFHLNDSRLNGDQWRAWLLAWVDVQPYNWLRPVNWRCDDEGTWRADLFVSGSIRGVRVRLYEDGSAAVRLGGLASAEDYQLARRVMTSASCAGGGSWMRHDGANVGRGPRSGQMQQLAHSEFCRYGQHLRAAIERAGGGVTRLDIADFELEIDRGDIPKHIDLGHVAEIEPRLAQRVERILTAYTSHSLLFQNGVRMAAWPMISTRVSTVDLVMLPYRDITVPMSLVLRILGDRALRVGDDEYVFPGIDRDADAELLERLVEAHVSPEDYSDRHRILPVQPGTVLVEGNQVGHLRPFVDVLVDEILRGHDRDAMRRAVVRAGMPADECDEIISSVIEITRALAHASGEIPEQTIRRISRSGIPGSLARMVFTCLLLRMPAPPRATYESPARGTSAHQSS